MLNNEDTTNRRSFLVNGGVGAVGLAFGACASTDAVLTPALREILCATYNDVKGRYPELRALAIKYRSALSEDLWSALVKFDQRADEIGIVLNAACTFSAPATNSTKWMEAAAIVSQVVQVGFKVAVAAGAI